MSTAGVADRNDVGDRQGALHRADAARLWVRGGAATGSLALLDSEVECHVPLLSQLRALGVEVDLYRDDLSALVHLGAQPPDVMVVSSAMPTASLARLVTVLRTEFDAPVLLSYETDKLDEIGPAVVAGAQPVVSRPYRLEAFLAAVEPHWPRQPREPVRLRVGELELDLDGYDARLGGVGLDFTGIEFTLLVVLARSADHVVRRVAIAERCWPLSPDPDGVIVATITRIRRKFTAAGAPAAVHTVRGLGYRLESKGLSLARGAPRA